MDGKSKEEKQAGGNTTTDEGTTEPIVKEKICTNCHEQEKPSDSIKESEEVKSPVERFDYFFEFPGFLDGTPAGDFNILEIQDIDQYFKGIRIPHKLEKTIKEDLKDRDLEDALLCQSERYTRKRNSAIETFSKISKDVQLMSAESEFFARLLAGPDKGASLKALEEAFTGYDLKAGMSAIPEETRNKAKAIHRNMMHYKEHGEWWRTQIGFLDSTQRKLVSQEDQATK